MIGTFRLREREGGYEVIVNDKEIRNVTALSIDMTCDDDIPEVDLTIHAKPDIECLASIISSFDMSEGVTDAINTLKFVTMVDKDIQEGFIASIRSALDDIERSGVKDHHIAAQFIYNRVFGE